MIKRNTRFICTIVITIIGALYVWAKPDDAITFPSDYRQWAHVKSMLIGPASAAYKAEGGIHHIYANEKALAGYRTGQFPDGSILVYDLLEAKEVAPGITVEGTTRRVDVMVKDSRRYSASAGWGWASFPGGDRTNGTLTAERAGECLKCHTAKKGHDYVQSEFRR